MRLRNKFLLFIPFLLALLGPFVFSFAPMADNGNNNGDQPRLVIKNNRLSGSGFGIYIGPRDEEVLITGNTLTGNAEAIRLTGVKKENLVTDNRIVDNLAGITVRDMYSANEKGYIKYPVDPDNIQIRSNQFRGNEEGNIINLLEKAEEEDSDSAESNPTGSEAKSYTQTEPSKDEASNSEATSKDTKKVYGQNDESAQKNGSQKAGESAQDDSPKSEKVVEANKRGSERAPNLVKENSESSKESEEQEVSSETSVNHDPEEKVNEDGSESKKQQVSETSASQSSGQDSEKKGGQENDTEKAEGSSDESSSSFKEELEKEQASESEAERKKNKSSEGYNKGAQASEGDIDDGFGNPYIIAGATLVGLTTLLLVLKSSL